MIRIRPATIEEILSLRHAILRAGLPAESARFDGDEAADTCHFAADEEGRVVGCVTIMLHELAGRPAWQLRGMAVDGAYQFRGIGRQLLQIVERTVRQRPPSLLWCNARRPAMEFYRRHGWQVISEEFDIPTAGPHVRMMRELDEQAPSVGRFSPRFS